MNGVSLDLSKPRTGLCRWKDDRPLYVVSAKFSEHKYFGAVLHQFRNFVREYVLPGLDMDWIAYEEIRPRNKSHMELHFGMVGILARMCYEADVPLFGVNCSTHKKFLSGHGNADKETMVKAAVMAYPHLKVSNHDEAEAVSVGAYIVSRVKVKEAAGQ